MLFRRQHKSHKNTSRGTVSGSNSYASSVRRQFRKNKAALWSLRILWVLLFIAVFADFIANEKPLYYQAAGKSYFPVLKQYAVDLGWDHWDAKYFGYDWKAQEYEKVLWPPIAYSASSIDIRNSQFRSPFDPQQVKSKRFWHWLGTDEIGRDVAAGMVAGTRTAMLVGVIAMSIASIIGIFFGALAGYFGDDRLRASPIRIICNLVALVLAIFYAFLARTFALATETAFATEMVKSLLLFLFIILLGNGLAWLLEKLTGWNKKKAIPVDLLIMRFIEVINSIPGLLLLLAIISVVDRPNIFTIMVIIGFIAWTGIARFIRAELLRIRELEYIQAVQAMGYGDWRIIWRHAIPNAIGPVLVAIAFGVAASILVEATLTFIGIGLSIDQVTWGSLLNEARRDFSAWWIAIIPGFAIFISVTVFNLIGDALSTAFDPKLNQ